MPSESKFTFLSKVFKFLKDDELPIVVDASKGWSAEYPSLSLDRRPPSPIYFSVAAHTVSDKPPRRGKQYFSSAHVFVLDDVGTKCPEPPVEPSYVLETSIGNFQYGYLIQPFTYPGAYESAMQLLAARGYTDAGSIDPVHLFRLPGSLHRTGFQAALRFNDFRKRKHFADWLEGFEIEMPDLRQPHPYKGRPVTRAQVDNDETYSWLLESRRITENVNASGWLSIVCPWFDRHTPSDSPTWMYARYKPGAQVFTCFHEGCAKRTNTDFVLWVNEEKLNEEKRSVTG